VIGPGRFALLGTLVVLALALALRLPRGDLAEWKGDEAIEFAKARAIVQEGARPRGLPTTEGPHAPAHPLYAFAAALAIRDRPEACRVEVALLWSGAIVLLWALGQRELGVHAALAAALLLAAHPDLVRRGRAAWYPNLAGPAAILLLLVLLRTVREPRGKAAGVLLGVSALTALLHYSTVGVAALGLVTSAWAAKRGADRRALAAGLVAALALATPFLAGEVGRGFEDTKAALDVAERGGRASRDPSAPERSRLAYFTASFAAFDLEGYARALGPSGEEATRASGPPRILLRTLAPLIALLALAGGALGLLELVRALWGRERLGAAGATLLFTLSAAAPFVALKLPARDHYVQPALAGLAVLAGIGLRHAAKLAAPETSALAAAFLFVFASAGVLEVRSVLASVDAGRAEPGSLYDLPFRDKERVSEIVLQNELALARYRRFEDVLLLEESFRELARRDPERTARFERALLHEAYWDLDYSVPRPRTPRGRAEIVLAPGPEQLVDEVGRSGRLVVRRLP
jgi:hypothetical protein